MYISVDSQNYEDNYYEYVYVMVGYVNVLW